MTREKIEEIFHNTESEWEGDNAFQGMQIIAKYTDNILQAAKRGMIFSISLEIIIEIKISEEDLISLAKLNWMIDSDIDCLACFV